MTVLRPTRLSSGYGDPSYSSDPFVGALLVAANYKSFVAAQPHSPNLFFVR